MRLRAAHLLIGTGPLVAVLAAVWVASAAAASSTAGGTPAPASPETVATYQRACAVCHGSRGEGSERGPRIVDSGAALVDYMLSTGRMPIAQPDSTIERHPPAFDEQTRAALVDYIASFGGGGAPIPTVDVQGADAARGGELFRLNCAACHSAAGSGGALLDQAAPDLRQATPTQVGEAIRGGPRPMPVFGPAALDDQQVNDVAAYIQTLQPPNHRGGIGLDYLGPFAEGAIGWIFGLGVMIGAVVLIERKRA